MRTGRTNSRWWVRSWLSYGWEGLDDLEDGATFLDEIGAPEVELGPADREFLEAIALPLDEYPSERESTG